MRSYIRPIESYWHMKVFIVFRTQKVKFLTTFKAIPTYKSGIYWIIQLTIYYVINLLCFYFQFERNDIFIFLKPLNFQHIKIRFNICWRSPGTNSKYSYHRSPFLISSGALNNHKTSHIRQPLDCGWLKMFLIYDKKTFK